MGGLFYDGRSLDRSTGLPAGPRAIFFKFSAPSPEPHRTFVLIAGAQRDMRRRVPMRELPVRPNSLDVLFGLFAVLLLTACAFSWF